MGLEPFLARRRWGVADALIPPSMNRTYGRILDLGCGDGGFLHSIEFGNRLGLDRRFPDVDYWDDHIGFIPYTIQRFFLLPGHFNHGSFDVVTMLAVLEHLNRTQVPEILERIYQILRPKGLFILTTPVPLAERVLNALTALRLVDEDMIDEHQHYYGKDELLRLLREGGFSDVSMGRFELGLNQWVRAQK